MTNVATTATVVSTTDYPSSGVILVDQELMTYTGTSAGTSFTGLTRGAFGTTAVAHSSGAYVTNILFSAAPSTAATPFTVGATGVVSAANIGQVPIYSSQPGSRFSIGAANVTYFTGESLTITVPAGPPRLYRLVLRQMVYSTTDCHARFSISTSSSSWSLLPTAGMTIHGGGRLPWPHASVVGGSWATANAEVYVTLSPGTYGFHVWVDITAGTGIVSNGPADYREFNDFYAVPM